MPIWLKLLLELPACIQISQSNLWQDPTHSSFRTKCLAAAQQPKCTLLPNQHWPGKAFKNAKQKGVQSFPSMQNSTELATLQLVKGTASLLPSRGQAGIVENIPS